MRMNAMFITNLTINTVRHLKNINIELSQERRKHLILTGKNGSGKSSVLEAVRTFLRDREYDKGNVRPVECAFNAATAWREKVSKGEVIVVFRDGRNQAPTALFLQQLVKLQTEKAVARGAGDPETVARLDQRFALIENTLRRLFADEMLQLQFASTTGQFSIMTKNREPFDLSTLSDGYAAVVNLLGEVMLSIAKQSGTGYDLPGFVLIDDLEIHLDIDLQEKILPLVTGFFPNIQFFVSTHSPVVLNSLGNAVVYDLENRTRRETPANYAYDTFVKRYAEIGQYSDQIKRVIDEYEKLLSKEQKTTQEEFRVLELRHYLTWIIHKLL